MNQNFSKDFYLSADELFANYPRKVHALLPLLHMVQKEKGFIDSSSMEEVASLCDVSVSHVQGVVTFYTMYAQSPQGKHKFSVCTNLSCFLRGSGEILDFLEEELGISAGHSSPDEKYYLEEVECLGACGYAPVVMVDEKYHENMDLSKVKSILTQYGSKKN